MQVITRFAPSPTGDLHLGGARTALYSWLYAKKMHGKFILRIEDSDAERSTERSVQSILAGLQWLGLTIDDGPYYQSQRLGRYQAVIKQLLATGHAYRCYCSVTRLEHLREQQIAQKIKPRYDGLCRHQQVKSNDNGYVVRFKNPQHGAVLFKDLVRGQLVFNNNELDDVIIARANGLPTYNFTVVVDDYDMAVTHVIRGDDHINNTPRQINIFSALNAPIPQYVHLPMILGADSKRLSKRDGAASVLDYRDAGILPGALLNYLVRLGWSHGDQEIFNMAEMIDYFNLAQINKAPAALNPQKLLWLNQQHLKATDPSVLAEILQWHFAQLAIDVGSGPDIVAVAALQRNRVKNLHDMAVQSAFFYQEPVYHEQLKAQYSTELQCVLQALLENMAELQDWQLTSIMDLLKAVACQYDMPLAKLTQTLRVALTGGNVSPAIDQTMVLLGAKTTVARIKQFMVFCV
jgi:glutamyl-tRNA synthetase